MAAKKRKKRRSNHKRKKQFSPAQRILVLIAFCLLSAAVILALFQRCGEKKKQTQEFSMDTTRGQGYTVCLDAGHGGDDPGACANSYEEADDTLALTLKIQEYLEEAGCMVIMTRTEDVYPTLEDRVYIANSADADALISIHRNTAANEDANGVEVWINSAEPANAVTLGSCLLSRIADTDTFDTSRGLQSGTSGDGDANYWINAASNMASCILEVGFISNDQDNKYYHEDMNEVAYAIANGILDALEENSAAGEQ